MLLKRIFYLIFISFTSSFLVYSDIKFIKELEIPSGKKESPFKTILDVKADNKGNIFVLDGVENKIKKFTPDGKFIKSAGGRGEGPGEMLGPTAINLDDEGRVYVVDIVGRKLLEFDNDLNFVKQIRFPIPRGCSDVFIYSNIFICYHDIELEGEKYFYIFSRDGKLINSFFEKIHKYAPRMKSTSEVIKNVGTFFYLLGKACLGKDKIAFTYMRPENPYTVYIIDLKGKVINQLQNKIRGYNPLEYYNFVKKYNPMKDRGKRMNFDQFVIQGLHFTKEQFLIIQICRVTKDEESECFLDIYIPEGRLLFNHYAFNERIFSVDQGDNVYTLKENLDSLTVKKYKLILSK